MITVSDLTYTYDVEQPLRFPDFTVPKGESCLLLGESGSGKTTLLHVMGGLLRFGNGRIKIDNTEIKTLTEPQLDHFRGQHIGFVFQKNHLITALNVRQNLLMAPYLAGLRIDHDRLENVLTQLGLTGKMYADVRALSQGQVQRVAIARAILNRPSLILADEPTSALDDKSCDRVISLLIDAAAENQSTLLVATHDHRLKSRIARQIMLSTHRPE